MPWIISTLIGNATVAALIALAAIVAMRLNRPAVAHVLWLLVIVKLLTPPIVPVTVIQDEVARVKALPVVVTPEVRQVTMPPPTHVATVHVQAPRVAPVIPLSAPTRAICIPCVLGAIWLSGSVAWLGLVVIRIARFRRLLRRGEPADDALQREVAGVAGRIGLRRPPVVWVIDAGISPLLWFVGGRVQLVLPRPLIASISRERREGVIAHELAHLRRRDHWVRLLEIVASAVLWWHPLVWLARRGLHEAEEQCCDAWVVAMHADDQGRRTYADALVDALELVSGQLPAGATGLGRVEHLKRRVTMILTCVPRTSISRVGKIALAAVCVTAILIMPVRGQPELGVPSGQSVSSSTTAPAATKSAGTDDQTRRAVTALIESAAQDANVAVKNAANAAIQRFGARAVPALLDAVRDPTLAETARPQLASLGADSLDALLDALESGEPAVRREALNAIATVLSSQLGMGPGGAPGGTPGMLPPGAFGGAAPAGYGGGFAAGMEGVMPGAGDPSAGMAEGITRLTRAVVKTTRDDDVEVRRSAMRVFACVAPGAAMSGQLDTVLPSILAAMKDTDAQVRGGAAWVLVSIGPAASTGAVDALVAAMKDDDAGVRQSALTALKTMGPAAKAATPTVIAALKDAQPTVRAAAAEALGAIQSTPVGPTDGAVDPAVLPQ